MIIEKMTTNKPGKDKLVINVGGVRHETTWSTIEKIQGTRLFLLSKLREHDESYDPTEKEYYFDRNPDAFLPILEYYRTDELHMNDNICGNAMKKELLFWGLFEVEIEACCWGEYSKFLDHRETLANLDDTFGGGQLEPEQLSQLSCWKRYQMIIWNHLEYPSYSRGAKALMFISITVVMISILSFVCESHYWFQVLKSNESTPAEDPENYYPASSKQMCCNTNNNGSEYPATKTVKYLNYVDWGCLIFFSIELILRFLFAPKKCAFFKGLLNIIDIICIVPQIISITLENLENSLSADAVRLGDILQLASILRTVRVLRIFKLMKHYSAFKVLAYTIKVSTKELLLMVVFLMSGVMIFASVIYYAEPTNFTSIPIGIWWALVTMTTVGYGDRVPNTLVGYIFGCLCVIGGVLVIAFTVPIVVNNFTLYYSHANSRAKLPIGSKRKREKTPKMVAVSPTFNSIPDRDAETPISNVTQDTNIMPEYGNNLSIYQKETDVKITPPKLNFSRQRGSVVSVKPLVSPKITNHHEEEARQIVQTFEQTNRHLMNERRKQYMMAFKRLEDKKKNFKG